MDSEVMLHKINKEVTDINIQVNTDNTEFKSINHKNTIEIKNLKGFNI